MASNVPNDTVVMNIDYWMICCIIVFQVGSTWEDIQAMQRESSKVLSSSSAQLRHKLMTAIDGMQSAVGIKDLGQLHYEPIRDTQNSIVIVTAQCVREFRPTPSVSLRWTKMGKLNKKQLSNYEDNFCGMKQLVAAVPVCVQISVFLFMYRKHVMVCRI